MIPDHRPLTLDPHSLLHPRRKFWPTLSTMIGIYVHIPFCRTRCPYCDFLRWTTPGAVPSTFVEALCREITAFDGPKAARSVFIGGGTPSLLAIADLHRIIDAIRNRFIYHYAQQLVRNTPIPPLRGMENTPPIPPLRGAENGHSIPPLRGADNGHSIPPLRGAENGHSIPPLGGAENGHSIPPLGGAENGHSIPPLGGAENGHSIPPLRGAENGHSIPPLGGADNGHSIPPLRGAENGHSIPPLGGAENGHSIPPLRGAENGHSIPPLGGAENGHSIPPLRGAENGHSIPPLRGAENGHSIPPLRGGRGGVHTELALSENTPLCPPQGGNQSAQGRHSDAILEDPEITIEVNADDVNAERARAWRDAGINRLSIGVQSFDDAVLRYLGRRHDAAQARKACEAAAKVFDNWSMDLIFGAQPVETWGDTLAEACRFSPAHISAYGLTYEEGTPFATRRADAVDDEKWLALYRETEAVLANYAHYEISNYARPGRECRHNLIYWHNDEYAGFGPGAYSFLDGVRSRNTDDLDAYLSQPGRRIENLRLSDREIRLETVIQYLRLREGLPKRAYAERFGNAVEADFGAALHALAERGLIQETADAWRPTPGGFELNNEIGLALVNIASMHQKHT